MTNIDRGGLPLALPLTGLLTIEKRGTSEEFVIEKALVDVESEAFKYFISRRNEWAAGDKFSSPGPRQFWGPVADYIPKTVYLNKVEGNNRKFNFGKELDLFQS
jgi:pyrophosphate--fructose-6-phosphate 1-phosphotransferase